MGQMDPFQKAFRGRNTLVKTLLEKEILEERFVQEDRPILRDAKSIERPSLSLAQEKALSLVKAKLGRERRCIIRRGNFFWKNRSLFLFN